MIYETTLIQGASMEELAAAMNEFWSRPAKISVRDITLVPEMRQSQLSPTQAVVVFSCIVTYKLYDLAD